MEQPQRAPEPDRRRFVGNLIISILALLGGSFLGWRLWKRRAPNDGQWQNTVWQLDPLKCNHCGRCATNCVLHPSAVKCVHQYDLCGYCKLCFGYFRQKSVSLTEDAENQTCPMGAIKRIFVEEPFYEYTINEAVCIGCAKCVTGCTAFGNGSLYLQVRHDRCLNCNECSIARNCPSGAFQRIPASQAYILKAIPQDEANDT